jgi:hypothetical protein
MRHNDSGPAARPADRGPPATASGCSTPQGFGPRIVAWALHRPPWTYIALTVAGVAAALIVAGLER